MNRRFLCSLLAWALFPVAPQAQAQSTPARIFSTAVNRLADLIEPDAAAPRQTMSFRLKITQAKGLPDFLVGHSADVAFEAPDHLRVSTVMQGDSISLARNGQQLWIYSPAKHFGVTGAAGIARFTARPDKKDDTKLKPIKLPLPRQQLTLLALLMQTERLPNETVGGLECQVIRLTPRPQATQFLHLPEGAWTLWVRQRDSFPARLAYTEPEGLQVTAEFQSIELQPSWPLDKWELHDAPGDHVEHVALSHLTKFLSVMEKILLQSIPCPGPATGERRLLAREGNGRLEEIDGTRVLFLKGTPEEMGRQQGILLKEEIHDVVDHILYGVGVGSSFAKGAWFFGELERAQQRLDPFIDRRYYREMDALGHAAEVSREEIRLANLFPELFHCSGFALFGKATAGGRLYHGRILDYLRGVGLEQNAVVMVYQPDRGNAWVNVGYAGFIGSVTAMNEKKVAIGEMGGRGEGHWDGKPMAELVREVMEKADTLEQAVDIMRRSPRTCEYYYVISDAKTHRAIGIAATPDKFETIRPGQAHPQLPDAFPDTVLMSANDRYRKLVERVRKGYGTFTPESARALMDRPVAMDSNIHAVLFAPDTLDFWVANADSKHVASAARYTHYNLADLLRPSPVDR